MNTFSFLSGHRTLTIISKFVSRGRIFNISVSHSKFLVLLLSVPVVLLEFTDASFLLLDVIYDDMDV